MKSRTLIAGIFAVAVATSQVAAQTAPKLFETQEKRHEIYNFHVLNPDNPADMLSLLGESAIATDSVEATPVDSTVIAEEPMAPYRTLPSYYMRPAVFDSFMLLDSIKIPRMGDVNAVNFNDSIYGWLVTDFFHGRMIRQAKQSFFVNYPYMVLYDEASLPEPPKKFESHVDPETAKIVIAEVAPVTAPEKQMEAKFERRHWLRTFNGSLQFSQAYVSPNWYQGGNNNLNMLVNAFYNVKLNPAFHPNFLFETTLQYKLGLNNAPDDELRDYNISEDIFQFNLLAGYKASKRWYYSTNVSFKTQFLNNYKPNSHELKGAFLSPGELNVGVGMTYNYVNPKKTFTFDLSLSPFSWNMKTCTNRRMDETAFGIDEGHNVVNEYGSSAEGKVSWTICDNISLRSRLFVFTNYDYAYGDWENTLSFNINRFLSTQIYVHMRYDTSTPECEDRDWHKFQLKEILSFGFAYKFSTI